jgi:transposase
LVGCSRRSDQVFLRWRDGPCGGGSLAALVFGSGVNRNTAILFYHKLREVIFDALAAEAPELLAGEIEVDESYFGGHRKGKRGRGAAGKVPVFGLLKRQGKVYVAIIANARSETLIPIIRDKI